MNKYRIVPTGAFALILALFVSVNSCTKIAKTLSLDLPMQTGSINIHIPATEDTINYLVFGPETSYFNVDSFVRSSTGEQFNGKSISKVTITECKLTVLNPTPANNIANFQNCSASLFSDVKEEPFTISLIDNPDLYANSLNIPIQNTDLSAYIGKYYSYYISGRLRKPITTPLECTLTYTYNVSVKG